MTTDLLPLQYIAFLINMNNTRVLTQGVKIDQSEGIAESGILEQAFVENVNRCQVSLLPSLCPLNIFPLAGLYVNPVFRAAAQLTEHMEQATHGCWLT